ncbi:DinB family protein [Peribacillus sp. SCS-37]|uniref:DinB family protein n=1 Tax=Paraperibacillus esterisolvens TaxID=3115296 RepID=UPI003905C53C
MEAAALNQLNKIRDWTIKTAEGLADDTANIQPEGFNNTIKWHLGHIITETEYFLFELAGHNGRIPPEYNRFFGPGTRPSEWREEGPLLGDLAEVLKSQVERMNQIKPEDLSVQLKESQHDFESLADSAAFSALHEALHLGQIKAMKRIVLSGKTKL